MPGKSSGIGAIGIGIKGGLPEIGSGTGANGIGNNGGKTIVTLFMDGLGTVGIGMVHASQTVGFVADAILVRPSSYPVAFPETSILLQYVV